MTNKVNNYFNSYYNYLKGFWLKNNPFNKTDYLKKYWLAFLRWAKKLQINPIRTRKISRIKYESGLIHTNCNKKENYKYICPYSFNKLYHNCEIIKTKWLDNDYNFDSFDIIFCVRIGKKDSYHDPIIDCHSSKTLHMVEVTDLKPPGTFNVFN